MKSFYPRLDKFSSGLVDWQHQRGPHKDPHMMTCLDIIAVSTMLVLR